MKDKKKNNIIIFDGVDNSGKTTIAKELSSRLGIPYFSYKRPDDLTDKNVSDANMLALDYIYRLLDSIDASIIIDRAHPSEYVYGPLLRGTPIGHTKMIDKLAAKIGAKIIICSKEKLTAKTNERLTESQLKSADMGFKYFIEETVCETLELDTTDEDLNSQLRKIVDFIIDDRYDIQSTYNKEFMDKYIPYKGNLYLTTAHIFANAIKDYYNPPSVIDVGCGPGHWTKALYDLGIKNVIGLDGSKDAKIRFFDEKRFILHDLRNELKLNTKYGLVLCVEVAEHIEPEYVDVFLDNLTSLGHKIFMTAAPPGQGGDMHVNEQPQDYWIEKMNERKFELDEQAMKYMFNSTCELVPGQDIVSFMPRNILCFKSSQTDMKDFLGDY